MRLNLAITSCLATVVLLPACGAPLRTVKSPDQFQETRRAFVRQNNTEYEGQLRTMLERMELEVSRASQPEEVTYDVLVVHGAGPAAGFAVGVLKGWGTIEDPAFARPEFDLVTGASSGALVATFAFAGTEIAYQRAGELALDPPFDFQSPSFFSYWPKRAAIMSNEKLQEGIARVFDGEVVASLAQGARDHRTLLIGVTDLDLGLGRYWDLTFEARSRPGDAGLARVRKVLLASTAVPPALPPVEIDGAYFTDGGVATTLFTGFDLEGVRWFAAEWKTRQPGVPMPALRVWIVLGRKLFIDARTIQPRWLEIAGRSLEISMEYDRLKALLALVYMFEEMDEMEGVRAELRYLAPSPEARLPEGLEELNDEALAREVFRLGVDLGSDPASWTRDPPDLGFLKEGRR